MGGFCSAISYTQMIQHSCVGLIAQNSPSTWHSVLQRNSARSSFSPVPSQVEKDRHCGVREVSVPQGLGCPRTDPSSRLG